MAARTKATVLAVTEMAPEAEAEVFAAAAVVVVAEAEELGPLGEVAEGTAKPVILPVSGPGGADADAPTPTR